MTINSELMPLKDLIEAEVKKIQDATSPPWNSATSRRTLELSLKSIVKAAFEGVKMEKKKHTNGCIEKYSNGWEPCDICHINRTVQSQQEKMSRFLGE